MALVLEGALLGSDALVWISLCKSLCPLCLCGSFSNKNYHRRGTRWRRRSLSRTTILMAQISRGRPLPNLIHPDLAGRRPPTSLEPWPVANCAEFKAVNKALLGGSKLNSLEVHTIRTATGALMPRCANCRITTAGTTTTSDPK